MVRVEKRTLEEVNKIIGDLIKQIQDKVKVDIINHYSNTIQEAFDVDLDFYENIYEKIISSSSVAIQNDTLFKNNFSKLNLVQKAFFLVPFIEVANRHYDRTITLLMTHYFKTKDKQFLAFVEILMDVDDVYGCRTAQAEAMVRTGSDDGLITFIQLTTFSIFGDFLYRKLMEEEEK